MKVIISESKKVVKESYEISDDLVAKLNSILADEFLAAEYYRLVRFAMKGNKMHRLDEVAAENGFDELDDHFKNLCEWMQSKGLKVELDRSRMEEITNCTKFDVSDGMTTSQVLDNLIQSEEEAIDVYESLIPETELDLNTMLCGFLKDEREHLKSLIDIRDEMGGGVGEEVEPSEIQNPDDVDVDNEITVDVEPSDEEPSADEEPSETDDGNEDVIQESTETITYTASGIQWDFDDIDFDELGLDPDGTYSDWCAQCDLPEEVDVEVPVDVVDQGDGAVEEYISEYLSDEYGFCHNGFSY